MQSAATCTYPSARFKSTWIHDSIDSVFMTVSVALEWQILGGHDFEGDGFGIPTRSCRHGMSRSQFTADVDDPPCEWGAHHLWVLVRVRCF